VLRALGLRAVAVGDARAPRQVDAAIREGYAAVSAPDGTILTPTADVAITGVRLRANGPSVE
jgi:hypothetical protein